MHRSSNIEDEIERSKHETQLRLIQSIVTLLHQAPWDQIDGVYIEIGVLCCRIECQILSSDFQFGHGICNAISQAQRVAKFLDTLPRNFPG